MSTTAIKNQSASDPRASPQRPQHSEILAKTLVLFVQKNKEQLDHAVASKRPQTSCSNFPVIEFAYGLLMALPPEEIQAYYNEAKYLLLQAYEDLMEKELPHPDENTPRVKALKASFRRNVPHLPTQMPDMMTDDLPYGQFHPKYLGDFFLPPHLHPEHYQCARNCDRCLGAEVQCMSGSEPVVFTADSREAGHLRAPRNDI